MTDSSEIGRYGTLRLLKRHEPDTTVAFFPIDDETVTFGRSKQCSVRLYYDCVSELHCTLQISEEHKAFLLVQGTNGLLVDGCQVNPAGFPDSGPTTVPLTNGSEIEIYKKRFRFEYPPKEIRAALLATPRHAKARRSLRMSMIRSAQVFTPRGEANGPPRTPQREEQDENVDWEALRTPIRVPSDDGTPEQETTLLEGKEDRDAFVVEEEKDLIVLELVDNQSQEEPVPSLMPKANRARSVAFSIPGETPPPRPASIPQSARVSQQTSLTAGSHRRRSEPSLHRAVVLRSAQRALLREKERFEEAQEEDEVEAEVSPERELGPNETGYNEDEGDAKDQDDRTDRPEPYPLFTPSSAAAPTRRTSPFKASLDAMRKVIPLRFNWKAPEEVPLPDDNHDNYEEEGLDDEENEIDEGGRHEDAEDSHAEDEDEQPVYRTPVRRNFGPFMTPQIQLNRPVQNVPVDVKTRASIGGESAETKIFGGAQRVRVVPPWKLADIVLPEPQKPIVAQDSRDIKKERISEEERQAIISRRKSALSTPNSLPMPGPRPSTFPPSTQIEAYTPGEDSNEDADTMLERMTQKMAGLRRKSESRKMRLSIGGRQQGEGFSLLASPERKARGHPGIDITGETLIQMKYSDVNGSGLPIKTVGSNEHDDLDLSQGTGGEDDRGPSADVPGSGAMSLTPRFDGVRELFRQPRTEPKTPSFAGFEAMFKERSEAAAKTPSFRGMKEMFSRATAGLATPRLDLGEIFDQDEDVDIVDHEDTVTTQHLVSSEDEVSPPASATRSSRTPTARASTSKRPYRKKDIAPVDVPSAVVEEQTSDQEDEDDDVTEIRPAPSVRRAAKRSARNTSTPVVGNAPSSGKSSSRGASRRQATTIALESDMKGVVVHKTTKTRRIVEDVSEDELAMSGKTNGKYKDQQTDETEVETNQTEKAPVRSKPGSRKAKEVEASDSESVAPPKPRRTRAAKTPQGRIDTMETTQAPTATKASRRIKDEEVPEVNTLAPAVSAPKTKRAARNKVSPDSMDDQSSEEATTTRSRVSKRGSDKKTIVSGDTMSEDKENSGQKQSDKTPAVRTRRVAVTPVETLDAPAKRTRSRK